MKKEKSINYFSTDFEDEFLADYKFDITQINKPKETFDLIICYHVLEHIVDDKKAMSELYRVLKPKGEIYIQTPFKEGHIYEDYTITSPIDREKHFGQNDHVRIYSITGLTERLKDIGFKTGTTNFKQEDRDIFNGFKSPETVIILTKTQQS
ncbi:MAG: class I SAM-dependent methyltransferase [Algibacter sp.]